jgi:hypothetical protein
MENEDLFIITADHGNDPGLRTGLHTREMTRSGLFTFFSCNVIGDEGMPGRLWRLLVQYFDLPKLKMEDHSLQK